MIQYYNHKHLLDKRTLTNLLSPDTVIISRGEAD